LLINLITVIVVCYVLILVSVWSTIVKLLFCVSVANEGVVDEQ